MLDGIIWILKTGLAWRDLPKQYFGPWKTVYERFRQWSQSGLWEKILLQLQANFEKEGLIDWELFSIDGSSVRAHKAAAGAKKTLLARGSLQTMPWGGVEVDSELKSTSSATAKAIRSKRK